jgi:hypothetical protein
MQKKIDPPPNRCQARNPIFEEEAVKINLGLCERRSDGRFRQ